MRFSWNEIRARATFFAADWRDAAYEKGECQSFYNDFFNIFGVSRRRVASFEKPVRLPDNRAGFIDLLWKGTLIVEQKSAGGNLIHAKEQVFDYFPGLRDADLPRYVLVSDFQRFELYDLEEGTDVRFLLADLPRQVEHFAFILGVQKRTFKDQDPANLKASRLLGSLHDALNASGYAGHALERLLVRLLFCLFADSTGIFEPRGIFLDLIEARTSADGADVGQWLGQLFEILDTRGDARQRALDEDLARFPHVNGALFAERLPTPAFNAIMRGLLLEACRFDWGQVSPAIFGSLFQSVMTSEQRRAQGAHYTTEKNILKLIRPLFLDDLWSEFEAIRRRRIGQDAEWARFHRKLETLRFFDPACGCGNFLVIAYRELRELEIAVMKERGREGQLSLSGRIQSRIDVDQFYGIELNEFPGRIAEVALWMMDHIMNNKLSAEFGELYARIPIRKTPHISAPQDALECDWNDLLPAAECSFVFGNPPFGGSKYQSESQRQQVRRVAQLGGSGGTLDYVTPWFIKGGEYIQQADPRIGPRIGFVATNSITQGEQVSQLWPLLFDRCGLEIAFAHRTFAWGSDARGKAHVHVVILGLAGREAAPAAKRLFSYGDLDGDPVESLHASLTPYLFDGSRLANPHLVVREEAAPLGAAPKLVSGTQPIDDGNLIFDRDARASLLRREPGAGSFLHPYVGSDEHINGIERWILHLRDADPVQLRSMPEVSRRLQEVRKFRSTRGRKSTLAIKDFPERFNVTVVPDAPFLVIPEVSSERREYVPIGWLEPPVIPSNLVRVMLGADLWHFGILTSRMHMAWLRYIGGRLESRYRYSIGIVYNPFPWPEAAPAQVGKVRELAQAILDARALYPGASMADLYDADLMKPALRKAHQRLDGAVDRLYRAGPFEGDRERVEHLFGLYERLRTPLLPAETPRRRARSRKAGAR